MSVNKGASKIPQFSTCVEHGICCMCRIATGKPFKKAKKRYIPKKK